MSRGLLITFEGGEACGKSTQIALLAERLRSTGRVCTLLREPGGTPMGEKIRHLVKEDPVGVGMAPEAELLLMNASRAELVHRVIRPALDRGEILLCDRFWDSTIAYQGYGRGLDLALVRSVIAAAVGGVRPDLTLWLRVDPTEAARRLVGRGQVTDRFESEKSAFFDRVEQGYAAQATAEPDRFRAVEAGGSREVVHDRIWGLVTPLLS
jgi:dTMP kinase